MNAPDAHKHVGAGFIRPGRIYARPREEIRLRPFDRLGAMAGQVNPSQNSFLSGADRMIRLLCHREFRQRPLKTPGQRQKQESPRIENRRIEQTVYEQDEA